MEQATWRFIGDEHRSISQLKTYTRCGELYRIERQTDADEPPAAWTALGSAFHMAYEDWERSERSLDFRAKFFEQYDMLIDECRGLQPDLKLWATPPGMSAETSIKHYRKRGGEKDVPNYIQHCEEAPWELVSLETPIDVTLFGGIFVRGTLDRLEFFPGTSEYAIEDIKTGSPEDEEDTRQLEFYAFAYNYILGLKAEHPDRVTKVRYWFTKVNRGSPWVFVDPKKDMAYWSKLFGDLDRAIREEIFLPNPGKKCGLCSYYKVCSFKGEQPW